MSNGFVRLIVTSISYAVLSMGDVNAQRQRQRMGGRVGENGDRFQATGSTQASHS